MIYRIFWFIIIVCTFSSYAQNKTFNNWCFSNNCGITFNTNPATAINGTAIQTREGSSSISDTLGNLLFYTDGVTVYDKNHLQMPNGFGLNGHFSSTQAALIVKNPIKNNIYYIFTTDAAPFFIGSCACLSYSIVDLNLNGGNGDVSVKNVFLYSNTSEKLTGVKNQADSIVWVLSHEYDTDNFYAYKVDSSGVNLVPVISNCGVGGTIVHNAASALGQMKISPDGTKVANCINSYSMVELFDFNDSTGQVLNPVTVITPATSNYGIEFSPNSKLLYVSNYGSNGYIIQYSLINYNATDITNSALSLEYQTSASMPYCSLQLAPDGKIYIAKLDGSIYTISHPDVLGTGAQFGYSGIAMPIFTPFGPSVCKLGLPNAIAGYYRTTYIPPIIEPEIVKCENYIIPNVITPNNDGINDEFKIECNKEFYVPQSLIIYNRWGEEVYNNLKHINKLNDVSDGVYFYTFKMGDIFFKGFLNVFH
jgi:gliding motility-associated-like protein